MNNVGEKYLPLGSVVMLKGASKRLMVTGFCTMAAEDESGVMYDYSGCMYPEGVISSDQTALFNHDQIEKVIKDTLEQLNIKNVKVTCQDKGALDYTIKARIVTALTRMEASNA